jgi:hypothetical protein
MEQAQPESWPCGEPNSIIKKCVNVSIREEMLTRGVKPWWLKWAKDSVRITTPIEIIVNELALDLKNVSSRKDNLAVKNPSSVGRKASKVSIDSRVGGAGEALEIERNGESVTSDAVDWLPGLVVGNSVVNDLERNLHIKAI